MSEDKQKGAMRAFELDELTAAASELGALYHEFLRVPDMSLGLYRLPGDGRDGQMPHKEDEVYYVISGKGQITVAGETRDVRPGSLVYVPAEAEHRFHDFPEGLELLVFFAPAESSG